MITNYNTYNKKKKIKYNDISFHLSIDINSIYYNIVNFSFNITINKEKNIIYSRLDIDKLYGLIVNNLSKIFTINTNFKTFKLKNKDAIYFTLKLNDLNYDRLGSLDMLIKYENYNIGIWFAKKYNNYNEFENDFNNISFNKDNIDNYIISLIEKDNSLYFEKIYQYIMSDNIKKHFKYLENAKNFDLL